MSLIMGGLAAAGAIAGGIGRRRRRKASERAGEQQMKFLEEDAAATRAMYADKAERYQEQGEKVLGTQTALSGKFGSVLHGQGASTQMVAEESEQNLSEDVQNIIAQGEQEASRILNQRDQLKSQVRTSKRTGFLDDISSIAGAAGSFAGGFQAFGGNPQLLGAEVGGFLNPFKKRKDHVGEVAGRLGVRNPYAPPPPPS